MVVDWQAAYRETVPVEQIVRVVASLMRPSLGSTRLIQMLQPPVDHQAPVVFGQELALGQAVEVQAADILSAGAMPLPLTAKRPTNRVSLAGVTMKVRR